MTVEKMDTDIIEAMAANGNLKAADIMSNPEGAAELLLKYHKPLSVDNSQENVSDALGISLEELKNWGSTVLFPMWKNVDTISGTIAEMYKYRHHTEYHMTFAQMLINKFREDTPSSHLTGDIKKDLKYVAEKYGIDIPEVLKDL